MRTSHPVLVVLFALLAGCGNGGDEPIAGVEEERVGDYSHVVADLGLALGPDATAADREAGSACVQGFGDPPTTPPLPVECHHSR